MHMAQIWVNLPRAHKMDPPRYQGLTASQMGEVQLPEGGGHVRVIAGTYQGVKGPVLTFTPVDMFDLRLHRAGRAPMSFPAHENVAILVLSGDVVINGSTEAEALDFVLFENEGEDIAVEARSESQLLLLGGEPIDEPVVHYGPFVMSTREEIRQAIDDFNRGAFGSLED
jgi:redox-sensitive bicupin YhaK (pirin superfamily)